MVSVFAGNRFWGRQRQKVRGWNGMGDDEWECWMDGWMDYCKFNNLLQP